jgi:IrrE N-terminal-like domain
VSRTDYYATVKRQARDTRAQYGLDSPRVLRSDLRRIYADQHIRIDRRPGFRQLRGAYFWDEEFGASVLVSDRLPPEPAIFTLGHELKHHLMDRADGIGWYLLCDESQRSEEREIAAEIFAAELVYPDEDFVRDLESMHIGHGECDARTIVRLKHFTRSTLSYASLAKRATFFRFSLPGALDGIKWRALERDELGEPAHERIQRYRAARYSEGRRA